MIDSLIADARADPAFKERGDVLALLLQARYENGEPIPDRHIADELLTMLVAGHETTSTQLTWAVEQQRTRPVLTASSRRTKKRIRLGDWVIPEDNTVMASIQLAQASEESFRRGVVQPGLKGPNSHEGSLD